MIWRTAALVVVALVLLSAGAALPAGTAPPAAPTLPETPYRYANLDLPPHFNGGPGSALDNTPPDNPLTDEGAALGRVLFYDRRLSATGTVSCGSCHIQERGFTDGRRFSRGFAGEATDRRSMPLANLRYYQRARFFWDERAAGLEEMVLLPIEHPVEMGHTVDAVVEQLQADRFYQQLFAAAFGDPAITGKLVGMALAQFVRSLVSYRSPYDEGRARVASLNEDFPNFTVQENRGKALFVRHCSSCHLPSDDAHFFMTEPANTGLEAPSRRADGGVGDVTLRDADLGAFKAPSLRNVEVAGPYMHDGRLPTLEAVIDHYSNGFLPHPFLDSRIRALNFTASEKAALVQFLSTLTDQAFLTDPKFSDPFPAPPRVIDRDERQAMVLPAPPGLGLRPVVERIRSFDVDDDGRVAADELPHRLRHWVERGDSDGDRALDEEETTMLAVIRPLGKPSERARAATDARVVRLRFGGWAGSRAPEGLDGLLSDLKLAPETRKRVLALLSTPKPESELLPRAKALLTPEEYENLAAALARQQAVAAGGVRGVISGVAGGLRVAPPPPSPPPPPPPPPTVRRL